MKKSYFIRKAMRDFFLYELKTLPAQLAGFVMVAVAYRYRKTNLADLPKWILPWANPEDWTGGTLGHKPEDNCVPRNLRDQYQGFWGFYRYHAMRNRAHGLRNYEWSHIHLVEGAIQYYSPSYVRWYADWYLYKQGLAIAGNEFWYGAWQDKCYGFYWIKYFNAFGKVRYVNWKLGWRITPSDAVDGNPGTSVRWKIGTTPTWQIFPKFGTAGSDYD